MSKGRVLVTGATGFVGRATVVALVEAGWQVTQGMRQKGADAVGAQCYLDLSDPISVLLLASRGPFDAIVHLGAHVGLAGVGLADMYEPNVLATGCFADLAKQWGAHLVFASTVIVGGVRSEHITMESPTLADTAYAQTKWLGEQLIEASSASHCILRIAGVFGLHGPTHLGLNRAIEGALCGKRPVLLGAGSALRNYVYVKDVARAISQVLDVRITGRHLLAGSETLSVAEMLGAICDTFLPGQSPEQKEGGEASDQVVETSVALPTPRRFRESLADIHADAVEVGARVP
jgi:nucleoside-diphosphate-sugar epimerase